MASWENKLYNFLYRLCCTDLITFTRKFNWLNLLIHCLPGSNIVTLDSKRLFTIVALWLIFSCVVLEHTAAFFPRKRFKRHQKNSRHRKHHLLLKEMVDFASRLCMGMSFAYFIIEGTFFVTEKSCYGAVYQVLMIHDLDLLLVLLIDLLQSSFYRSSSCSRSFLLLLLLLNTHKSTFWQ